MTNRHNLLAAILGALVGSSAHAAGLPEDCRQLVVAIAPDSNSMHGRLQLLERQGSTWQRSGRPWPVLFGKNGIAWGSGIAGQGEAGLHKHERDGRAPAGIFRLGKIYTYDSSLPSGSDYPFRQVTEADAWVDDSGSSDYNRFVTIPDPANPPPWFEKQKMRHNDFAYRWLVEIRHNSDPPVAGEGSAIFFHIRRGETRPTAGCTTMAEGNLVRLITWLRVPKRPCYLLLTADDYKKKAAEWRLPPVELVSPD